MKLIRNLKFLFFINLVYIILFFSMKFTDESGSDIFSNNVEASFHFYLNVLIILNLF